MTEGKYILGGHNGRTPVPVEDLLVWGQWMEKSGRHVADNFVVEAARSVLRRNYYFILPFTVFFCWLLVYSFIFTYHYITPAFILSKFLICGFMGYVFGKLIAENYYRDTEEARVSTVFLGLDHRFWGEGQPILFETMIFGGPFNDNQTMYCDYQERYCTWGQAETGHEAALKMVLSDFYKKGRVAKAI